MAQICHSGRTHHLGVFDTREQAALAYDIQARKHAPHKVLNYPTLDQAHDAADQAEAEQILAHRLSAPSLKRSRSASGYFGVCASGKRWQVIIGYNGQKHALGRFDCKEQAARAYDRAAKQHAPGRPLNFPDD